MSLRGLESESWASPLDYDTREFLVQIDKTPYMMMYGGLDFLVHLSVYLEPANEAIAKSGSPDAQMVVFEKTNGLWQVAKTGHLSETFSLRPRYYPSFIRPGFSEFVTNWILDRVALAGE